MGGSGKSFLRNHTGKAYWKYSNLQKCEAIWISKDIPCQRLITLTTLFSPMRIISVNKCQAVVLNLSYAC